MDLRPGVMRVFTVYCTVVAAEVLLGPANIDALVSVEGELAIDYRCSCGEKGRWWRGKGEPAKIARAS